jgi:hypothetical protein
MCIYIYIYIYITHVAAIGWGRESRIGYPCCKKRLSSPYNRPRSPRGGVEVSLYSFFNLGTRWGGWSTPRPGRFNPGKEIRYPLYRRLGGPQGRSGRVRKTLPATGIQSPDRPARSQLLYRLSYRRPHSCSKTCVNKTPPPRVRLMYPAAVLRTEPRD